jgi:uncharacterized protein (TIGR02145 family)
MFSKKIIQSFFLIINVYSFAQTVTIGTQVWTTKNLNVTTFSNGELIPQAKTDSEWKSAAENNQPAWCYYDNDSSNGIKYGILYNWFAVNDPRGIAPEGFHIPTNAEWDTLVAFLGGEDIAGKKVKSTSGWNKLGNGTNSTGFSGLPGGNRYYDGNYTNIGEGACWWSYWENDSLNTFYRHVWFSFDDFEKGYDLYKLYGCSVRCIKD